MAQDEHNKAPKDERQLPPHRLAVERNPWLQEHWFTRLMAPAVIGGATMNDPDYRRTTWFFWAVLFLVCVFGGNALLEDYALRDAVFVVTLCTLLILCIPVVIAARHGYRNRERIDTEGVPHLAMAKSVRIAFVLAIAAPVLFRYVAGLFDSL